VLICANTITLQSDQMTVTLLPDKGCDVYSIVDRQSGVDVLFKSPWGIRLAPWVGQTSMERWIEAYPGGWQLLLPNGGDECMHEGSRFGYHGEAAMVRWEVVRRDALEAMLTATLTSAPLSVRRSFVVEGRVMRVTETVMNTSPVPFECMWSHHPAFGAPFVDETTRMAIGCRTIVADDRAPGTLLDADRRYDWPLVKCSDGAMVDLSRIPAPKEARAMLAYCEDFVEPYFALTSQRLGLGVGFRWPLERFPKAWLWQEIHSESGWPWYRRAYVVAVEPASTIPGQGFKRALAKNQRGVCFAPGESIEAVVEVVLFHDTREVVGIDEGGQVRFA